MNAAEIAVLVQDLRTYTSYKNAATLIESQQKEIEGWKEKFNQVWFNLERLLSSCQRSFTKSELALEITRSQLLEKEIEVTMEIEELRKIVPCPPNAITWERGIEILNHVQKLCWP